MNAADPSAGSRWACNLAVALARRLTWFVIGLATACSQTSAEVAPPAVPTVAGRPSIEFSFRATDRTLLDSYHTRGRATALLFLTTYDWASQVLARRLADVVLRHRPRINAGAVVLEAEDYRTMADVFRSSLGLPYPVAMADDATREGKGPFGSFPRVPTLVILDRDGREVWRQPGLVETHQIHEVLDRAAGSGSLSPDSTSPENPAVGEGS